VDNAQAARTFAARLCVRTHVRLMKNIMATATKRSIGRPDSHATCGTGT
jgi:hypothetical protein